MKKFVLTTTMVFLTAIYSFGQEIGFGVKAGLSLANLTETSYHVRPGLVIGGFANIRFNDYVALQPELQYAMQGGKYNEVAAKLDYIQIPVMVKGYLWKGLNLELGPQLGFRVVGKSKIGDESYSIKDATNVCDFAIGVGLGYETEMGLTAGFRYTISATKAIKDSDPKNSVFQLALGWKF
ncbi:MULTISPECIES: porin family protein [Bacteroidales]|jgi:hypothetical protein|uniref:porin family protein n=1 Tax=Bacteroidales TaxID=171549 RepID=UPI00093D41A3|nr:MULTISPECIES: porin family protein [Bacteroidales]